MPGPGSIAWVGHFSAPFVQIMGLRKQSSGCVGVPISGTEALFSVCRSNHWPTAVTIESSLESGHGLSPESSQDGCTGTCVKLEASNSMRRGTIGLK